MSDTIDVFISYRRSSGKHFAVEVYDHLRRAGFYPFLDIYGLQEARFSQQIFKKIEQANNFILILESNIIQMCNERGGSDWITKELNYAHNENKNILFFCDEDFDLSQEEPCLWNDGISFKKDHEKQSVIKYNRLDRDRVFEEMEGILQKNNYDAGAKMTRTIHNVDYVFRYCPPGEFDFGSTVDEQKQCCTFWGNEFRQRVKIPSGFWILETPVTQEMWQSVMGNYRSKISDPQKPVVRVSYNDCEQFCRKLSGEGLHAKMPREVQWEYACRAGTTTPFSFGNTLDGDKANCDGSYPYPRNHNKGESWDSTTPVRSYPPNPWGIYDMHGNVWEWCSDLYRVNPFKNSYSEDGIITLEDDNKEHELRVNRGGSWDMVACLSRSASRSRYYSDYGRYYIGFRFILGISPQCDF